MATEGERDGHGSGGVLPKLPGQHLKGRHIIELDLPYLHLESEGGVDLLPLEVGLDKHAQMVSLEGITLNINAAEGDIPLGIDKILVDGPHVGDLVAGYIQTQFVVAQRLQKGIENALLLKCDEIAA